MPTKSIKIDGRSARISGDAEDSYFQNAQGFMDGHPELFRLCRSHVSDDAICLDVGANIGLTAIFLSRHCRRGHVYAFEASPVNARHLRENLARNDISNCTVIESAVSDGPGELVLHTSGAGSHVMTDAHEYKESWPSVRVPMLSLDAFVSTQGLERLDFIKMDIEGWEPVALRGATTTIAKLRPMLFMEFNSWSLYFAHKFDPMTFAKQLWSEFDVSSVQADGSLISTAGGDPVRFLHDNMTAHGCVDDLVLRPRAVSRCMKP